MSKLALVLSILVLLLATIPCCLADSCQNEKAITEQNNKSKNTDAETDCGLCSPFFRCHGCHGTAFAPSTSRMVLLLFPELNHYPVYRQTFFFQFAPSIWQPPKIA